MCRRPPRLRRWRHGCNSSLSSCSTGGRPASSGFEAGGNGGPASPSRPRSTASGVGWRRGRRHRPLPRDGLRQARSSPWPAVAVAAAPAGTAPGEPAPGPVAPEAAAVRPISFRASPAATGDGSDGAGGGAGTSSGGGGGGIRGQPRTAPPGSTHSISLKRARRQRQGQRGRSRRRRWRWRVHRWRRVAVATVHVRQRRRRRRWRWLLGGQLDLRQHVRLHHRCGRRRQRGELERPGSVTLTWNVDAMSVTNPGTQSNVSGTAISNRAPSATALGRRPVTLTGLRAAGRSVRSLLDRGDHRHTDHGVRLLGDDHRHRHSGPAATTTFTWNDHQHGYRDQPGHQSNVSGTAITDLTTSATDSSSPRPPSHPGRRPACPPGCRSTPPPGPSPARRPPPAPAR